MRTRLLSKNAAGLAIAASLVVVPSLVCAAPGDEPTVPKITYNGYLDGYFQYDFARPLNGDSLTGRGLDIAHNRVTLAVAELDIAKGTNAKSPLGFTLFLYAGRSPDIIHLTEPGGRNTFKLIRQAYATYEIEGKTPVTLDFGKFDTWIGYEGIDNRSQDQYSRSFNWTYSETTYETGLRATAKLSDKLTGALYVVQGWNEVQDGNNGKSLGIALTYAPDATTTYVLQNHYGVEGSNKPNDVGSFGGIGFPNPGTARVNLVDFIVTKQLDPTTKIAFNVDYGTSVGATNDGRWNGEVLYLQHKLNAKQVVALRLDRFDDTDGLRTGAPVTLYSLTGTFDYTLSNAATLRFELRQDMANNAFFPSDSGLRKQRTTATIAAVLKF